jgi:hypothetical protein
MGFLNKVQAKTANTAMLQTAISHIPEIYRKGIKFKVEKTRGLGDSFYNRHNNTVTIDPSQFLPRGQYRGNSEEWFKKHPKGLIESHSRYELKGEEYSQDHLLNTIAHEVGHSLWYKCDENKIRKILRPINTDTLVAYDDYISNKDTKEGPIATKFDRETLAEMFRLFIVKGQFKREFKSLGIK